MISILVGAPGCGKTTVAPYVAALSHFSELNGRSESETSLLIDGFLTRYLDGRGSDGLPLLTHYLSENFLDFNSAIDLLYFRSAKVSETGDFPHYQESNGEIDRTLTPRANAYMLNKLVENEAKVAISGTGMAMHRFLPVLRRFPEMFVKVIAPSSDYCGYFKNNLDLALKVRSGGAGRANRRWVDPSVLRKLYKNQVDYLQPGGYWDRLVGLYTFEQLALLIESAHSDTSFQSEVAEIQAHFDAYCCVAG